MFQIIATCRNGHEQTIKFDGSFTREAVQFQAGLLDGTCPMFTVPVGPDSPLGKCGICLHEAERLVPIKCQVSEYKP